MKKLTKPIWKARMTFRSLEDKDVYKDIDYYIPMPTKKEKEKVEREIFEKYSKKLKGYEKVAFSCFPAWDKSSDKRG